MKEIFLAPDGARVIDSMVLSCGNIVDCEVMRHRLKYIRVNVPLDAIGKGQNGVWFGPFLRLFEFCQNQTPKIELIDGFQVVRNFAGDAHATHVLRSGSYIKFGQFLGEDLGVLTHIALILDKNHTFRIENREVKIKNYVDLGGNGIPVYHLGTVVRVPLTDEQVTQIKSEQRQSKTLWKYLGRANGKTVTLTPETLAAIEAEKKAEH